MRRSFFVLAVFICYLSANTGHLAFAGEPSTSTSKMISSINDTIHLSMDFLSITKDSHIREKLYKGISLLADFAAKITRDEREGVKRSYPDVARQMDEIIKDLARLSKDL
ncbi:MAG: hypothetical protein COU34_02900 [Candidatus Magasanikbacteria bacterium CG10_big_fil_rev_8_21_14_0_10_43_9]|nr:MAG: hypothetical protein COU34_02900 [Candidatus Magasanikbacteria bacterium CG10_big_fil_rev_8_21_14_0_10_43_9]